MKLTLVFQLVLAQTITITSTVREMISISDQTTVTLGRETIRPQPTVNIPALPATILITSTSNIIQPETSLLRTIESKETVVTSEPTTTAEPTLPTSTNSSNSISQNRNPNSFIGLWIGLGVLLLVVPLGFLLWYKQRKSQPKKAAHIHAPPPQLNPKPDIQGHSFASKSAIISATSIAKPYTVARKVSQYSDLETINEEENQYYGNSHNLENSLTIQTSLSNNYNRDDQPPLTGVSMQSSTGWGRRLSSVMSRISSYSIMQVFRTNSTVPPLPQDVRHYPSFYTTTRTSDSGTLSKKSSYAETISSNYQ
jgi:hypothetical protein